MRRAADDAKEVVTGKVPLKHWQNPILTFQDRLNSSTESDGYPVHDLDLLNLR